MEMCMDSSTYNDKDIEENKEKIEEKFKEKIDKIFT